jgi:DHA1 family bicyclomycin/chloramphenicol resistance-like MFS transporter
MAVAPILAPFIGSGMLAWFGWRGVFAALAGIGAVLLGASWVMLAETNPHGDPEAVRAGRLTGNYAAVLSHRGFLGYMLTVACSTGGLFTFHTGGPFVLIGLFGLAPSRFGVFFALIMVGHIAGSMLSGRLAMRVGIDRVLLIGLAVGLAGGASMAALAVGGAAHVAAVVVPMGAVMFGHGMVFPAGAAGAILPFPRRAGAASALLGFLQMIAGSLGGIVMGRLYDGTPRPMAALIAGFSAAGLIGFWALIWRRSPRHRPFDQGK